MSFPAPASGPHRSALRGRGRLARLVSGLWMLLYAVTVAAAPVADGLVDHHEQVVVHIEDANGGDCPSSHGPEACDICQLAHGLRAVLVPATLTIPRLSDAVSRPVADVATLSASLHFLDGRSSRAPPLG